MLTVTVKESEDGVVLQCKGRIVRGDETTILCAVFRRKERNVILDLSGVDTIDAAGIGSLVSLQASGIYLTLMNPTEHVRELLKVTQLDSIFEISQAAAAPAAVEEPIASEPCVTMARAGV
jgi:anti-anti-sigma factor